MNLRIRERSRPDGYNCQMKPQNTTVAHSENSTQTGSGTTRHSSARGGAFRKDILRAITKGRKRFWSIVAIAALGTMMFSGLQAGCQDLRVCADRFFDAQGLHDLQIVSTLGLTEGDVQALSALDSVEKAEGIYTETVSLSLQDNSVMDAGLVTLSTQGIDVPYIVEGSLPQKADEAAVSQKFARDTGLGVGDTFTVTPEDSVPGGDADASDSSGGTSGTPDPSGFEISLPEESGSKSHLLCTAFTVTGIVTDPQDVDNPFSAVAYRTDSTKKDTAFILKEAVDSTVYSSVVLTVKNSDKLFCFGEDYESLVRKTGDAIRDTVRSDRIQARYHEVADSAQQELDDQKAEAQAKLSDAEKELNGNRRKLTASEEKLNETRQRLEEASASLDTQQQALDAQTASIRSQLPEDVPVPEPQASQLASARAQLETVRQQLKEGQAKYESGLAEYQDGLARLNQAETELDEKRADLEQEFADAQDKIDRIGLPSWYIRSRESLSGYSNISSDADSIQSIGTVFPIVFFLVAFLVSLTTITRMVEEDRGLIGTYKSLGFTDREIRRKYLAFAGLACLTGVTAGTLLAFLGLPTFLFTVFQVMYLIPSFVYTFIPGWGISGALLFLFGIVLAASLACRNQLKQVPATLMRPKAPPAGSRVFLERITHVWRRFSFLQKVTARNLFRYKKRMFMTIFGIGGCMALLLFGFSIRDSVADLRPRQYGEIQRYDLMAVSSEENNENLLQIMDADTGTAVQDCLSAGIQSVKISVQGTSDSPDSGSQKELSVQLIVVPDGADLSPYTRLVSGGKELRLNDKAVICTLNASKVLGFAAGDPVRIQLPDLSEAEAEITQISDNYLGNMVYMTRSAFESLFGEDAYEANAVFANLLLPADQQAAYADRLSEKDGVLTAVSTQKLKDEFEDTFRLMNMVVAIIIVMSAALAFVVLFTLQTTNISERERELATMKVLGFYDREVHSYVNRETFLLSAIGIVLGMPLGRLFAQSLVVILNLPSIYLKVSLWRISYLYAAGLTILFALIVGLVTNRTLNRIDPVTALKSIE